MLNVRKMEETGGAMGLEETLNEDLTSSSESNNIDVHMEKNTEYGALAILSASSYGNPNKVEDGNTTTGNTTGVVMRINNEWTAAAKSTHSQARNFVNAAVRYKNLYEYSNKEYKSKIGEALSETEGWHGASNRLLFGQYSEYAGIIRSYSGSIFSYCGQYASNTSGISKFDQVWSTRAVVVSGEEL